MICACTRSDAWTFDEQMHEHEAPERSGSVSSSARQVKLPVAASVGKVTAKKQGTVTIKVQTPNGLEAQTVLKISEPESGLDNRNVNVRFARIRSLASDTLNER